MVCIHNDFRQLYIHTWIDNPCCQSLAVVFLATPVMSAVIHLSLHVQVIRVEPCATLFSTCSGHCNCYMITSRIYIVLKKNRYLLSFQQNNGTNPSVKFASEILKLYTSHNITASLAQHNITPSDTKPPYPVSGCNIDSSVVCTSTAHSCTIDFLAQGHRECVQQQSYSWLSSQLDHVTKKIEVLDAHSCSLQLSDSECVLTRIGFCFNYTKSLEPIVIDCPDLYPDHKERPLPWILLDYSFKTYTEDGFVCNSSCTNVRYYGYGHD